METETISTPVETQEQTPLETVTDSQPVEEQTLENTEQEPANVEETAEIKEGEEVKEEVIDWEQRAKDNQASFTRVSQEKAELTKRIEELENQLKPKIVQEGKINPEFEQRYNFQVDDNEFRAYEGLPRQLNPEQRQEVENLLYEARNLYNPNNKKA